MVMVADQGDGAFALLARMTTRLASMADLDDIAGLVSGEIAALGFGAIWIAVLDEPTGHLITVRELIDGRDTTQEMPRISMLDMRQPIGHGFRERRMINVQRPESLLIIEEHPEGIPPGEMALPRVIFDHLRGHPFACGPLLGSRAQPVGALGLSSYRGREPLPDELFQDGLLRAFMSHLGIAMERALSVQQLERLNSDLVRTQNLLAQESRMRAVGELASAVAHDLNNLSGIVLMSLGSIVPVDAQTSQCVSRAERANQAVGELSRRLQRIARSGADPHTGPVDLKQLVDDIVVLIKPLCREDAIRLSFSAPEGPAVVQGEQTMVRQAVMNVVLNAREAVRAVAPERRSIDVSISSAGDSICLEVRDQGPGIPRELGVDIFKPFITTKEGHAGLGLATVYGSMKHFGGRVEVLQQPGGGACFRLTFNASLEASGGRAEVEPHRARQLRILVVDDEPEFVAVLRDALLQSGHEVAAADGADEAMNRVAHDDFDVILMDLGLPKRNGLEVIRAMRGEGISSKIVLMTGWDSEAVSGDPRVSFCDTLLQKPFRRRELDGVLSSLFQN
jgi:signal transduction histidine kinase/CheY-like chemotaxis protein